MEVKPGTRPQAAYASARAIKIIIPFWITPSRCGARERARLQHLIEPRAQDFSALLGIVPLLKAHQATVENRLPIDVDIGIESCKVTEIAPGTEPLITTGRLGQQPDDFMQSFHLHVRRPHTTA